MAFLKRKHFSLWITIFLAALFVDRTNGIQGIPTWMCLGIKSPFIEFQFEIEVLSNTSISLNITKDEQALMHQEGLKKLGTFIKPIDLRNSTTGYVNANLTKKVPTIPPGGRRRGMTENPIQDEMDRKEIILLDEDTDENGLPASLTDEDKKFIVPMALKNPTQNPKSTTMLIPSTTTTTPTTTTTTTSTTSTTTKAPEFVSNIDDLKNHILFLQNMTKHDMSFQSKFVVFPSLQKERTTTLIPTTIRTTSTYRSLYRYTPPSPIPTRRSSYVAPTRTTEPSRSKVLESYFNHDSGIPKEKITIVPQVLLLNDQTPPDDDDDDDNIHEMERRRMEEKDIRVTYSRRRNFRKSTTTTTKSTTLPTSKPTVTTTKITTTTTESSKTFRRNQKRRRNGNGEQRSKKRQQMCLNNPDLPKCQRKRLRQEQKLLLMAAQSNNASSLISSNWSMNKSSNHEPKLSRSARSHHKRRNVGMGNGGANGGMKVATNYGGTFYDGPNRDFLIPIGGMNGNVNVMGPTTNSVGFNNISVIPYEDTIDLNPDYCYKVDGLTYSQKKLCVLHTSVMPAISRGARSAIQECQHQFKNRRWNCSTTEDNTVFGPMSSIGSPEMAFIHALAAATVTSFIARACRDGQLASCGCSRSSRPKQLHDDWTWGGCGDDLEYAYRFSQDFVDIREKERKRGTRGLVSVPPKNKFDEKMFTNLPPTVDKDKSTTTKPTETFVETGSNNSTNTTNITKMSEQVGSEGNANKTNSDTNLKDTTDTNINNSDGLNRIKPQDLLELQERITKEILNSKLQEKEMYELQEKINREILNSKVFSKEHYAAIYGTATKRQSQRAINGGGPGGIGNHFGRMKNGVSAKARSLMNLHNNEAGRRAVIKKTRITCKCHGVSGSCSLITCWQQLSSIREIGDYLREKYDEATEVKLNKRGRLQVKDPQYKVPTAHDLVYLDESPDWCRNNRQLQWPGTHGRICNKTSSGLDGCGILCCGRGYNTKNIVVRERCNCKFHWCCQVKCEICVKVLEEHTCK